jgi:hypothetical protein
LASYEYDLRIFTEPRHLPKAAFSSSTITMISAVTPNAMNFT